MLRYFYLILLLVCIELCFCDKYITNQDLDYRNGLSDLVKSSSGRRQRLAGTKIHRKSRQTPDYDEEEEVPLTQIDVASFISNDKQDVANNNNNPGDPEDSSYELVKESYPKYAKSLYNDETPTVFKWNDNENLQEANYLNLEDNEPWTEDAKKSERKKHSFRFNREMNIGDLLNSEISKRADKDEASDSVESHENSGISHQPQKKCAFKHIRIPFFSHDKAVKATKKGKKRKPFCGTGKKGNSKVDLNKKNINNNNGISSNPDEMTPYIKIKKRSTYQEFVCPVCKSVFRSRETNNHKVKRAINDVVHNSRQFYEKAYKSRNPKAIEIDNKDPDENMDGLNNLENLEVRLARQSPTDEEVAYNTSRNYYDRSQQLRELEEVERRINEIGERTKNFEKIKHF